MTDAGISSLDSYVEVVFDQVFYMLASRFYRSKALIRADQGPWVCLTRCISKCVCFDQKAKTTQQAFLASNVTFSCVNIHIFFNV